MRATSARMFLVMMLSGIGDLLKVLSDGGSVNRCCSISREQFCLLVYNGGVVYSKRLF